MRYWISLWVCLLVAAPGCRSIECSDDVLPAIELTITEAGGERIDVITVRWSVDGGEFTVIDDTVAHCGNRTVCWFGYELPGQYEIQVIRGGVTVTTFIDVEADFCHVRTEAVTVLIPNA